MIDDKPDDTPSKADKLADEAMEAGRKFLETDTGKKVGEMTETAFEKAEELRKKAVESEFGRQALESELGRQAIDLARSANEQAKQAIPNPLGRNVAIGAAAGAVIALPLPFIGPLLGAIVGGSLGYLRSITKKS